MPDAVYDYVPKLERTHNEDTQIDVIVSSCTDI